MNPDLSEISEKSGSCCPTKFQFSIAYDWRSLCFTPKQEMNLRMMFKIQRSSNGKSVVFTLSGRIPTAALIELQKLLEGEAGDHNLVLDLKDVRLVDRTVVIFLAICEAKGMKLSNCPRYIREWIRKEAVQSEDR
jgi:hypothetical protein